MSKQHAETINLHQVICPSDIDLIVVDSCFGRKAYETRDKSDKLNAGKVTVEWGDK